MAALHSRCHTVKEKFSKVKMIDWQQAFTLILAKPRKMLDYFKNSATNDLWPTFDRDLPSILNERKTIAAKNKQILNHIRNALIEDLIMF